MFPIKKILQKIVFFLLFVFLIPSGVYAQYSIKGKVIDRDTKEPLGLVTLYLLGEKNKGTVTDIDGNFVLSSHKVIEKIEVNYLGYQTLLVDLSDNQYADFQNLVFSLIPKAYRLQELVIVPGENPAHKYIKKVFNNRDRNDPQKLKSYAFTSYNKALFDLIVKKESKKSSLYRFLDKNLLAENQNSHLMILETVSKKKFKYPNRSKEKVIASKASGIKNPNFGIIGTDIQSFGFYETFINLFDHRYLNPISRGSTSKYLFILQDTLFKKNSRDSTIVIRFRPRKNKNFDGLRGIMHINTKGYAIEKVEAEPADKKNLNVIFRQEYQWIEKAKQWFPSQLQVDLSLDKFPSKNLGMKLYQKTFYKDIEINPEIDNDFFDDLLVETQDDAGKKQDSFWQENRAEPLSVEDKRTYVVIDSISKKLHLNYLLKAGSSLVATGDIPLGKIDINPSTLVGINAYEGLKITLDLQTNDSWSKRLFLRGNVGAGLENTILSYGGTVGYNMNKRKTQSLVLNHQNFVSGSGIGNINITTEDVNKNNQTERWSAAYNFAFLKYFKASVYGLSDRTKTLAVTNTTFFIDYDEVSEVFPAYKNTEIGLQLQFSFLEKRTKQFGHEFVVGRKFPLITLSYARGLKGLLDGQFDYHKFRFSISDVLKIRKLGTFQYNIIGNWISSLENYDFIFNLPGSSQSKIIPGNLLIYVRNSFQTVQLEEFRSSRQLLVYLEHNFHSLLLKIGKFQPEILLRTNFAIGDLDTRKLDIFRNTPLSLNKGFWESGIHIENILKFNILNVVYIGFGGGFYLRHGYYSSKEFNDFQKTNSFDTNVPFSPPDNWVYKLSLKLGTR